MLLLPLLALAGFFAYKAHTAQQPRPMARTGATSAWVPTAVLTHGRVHRFAAHVPAHASSVPAIARLLAQRNWTDIHVQLSQDGATYQAIATWLGPTSHADPSEPASRTLQQLVHGQSTAGDEMSMSTAGLHRTGEWGWGGWGTYPTYLLEPEYAINRDPWGNPFLWGYADRLGGGPMVRRQA